VESSVTTNQTQSIETSTSEIDASDCSDAPIVDQSSLQSGTINTPDDRDCFRVDVERGDAIDMSYFSSGNTNVDIDNAAYSLENLENADINSGYGYYNIAPQAGVESSWRVWAEESGTLHVEIWRDSSDETTVPFDWEADLTTAKSTAGEDEYESDCENAPVVDQSSFQSDNIDTPNDRDCFRIDVERGDTIDMSYFAAGDTTVDIDNAAYSLENLENADINSGYGYYNIAPQAGVESSWQVIAEENSVLYVEVWREAGDESTLPFGWELTLGDGNTNTAPIADAGSDQTVQEGASVSLDGSSSTDPDGDSLSYEWTQTGGPSVQLSDSSTATPEFTAPDVSSQTTLTFEVTVDDGAATNTETVQITIEPDQTSGDNALSLTLDAPANAAPGETITVIADLENTGLSDAAGGNTALTNVPAPLSVSGDDTVFLGFGGNPVPAVGETISQSFEIMVPDSTQTGQDLTISSDAELQDSSGQTVTTTTTATLTISQGNRFDTNGQAGIQADEVVNAIVAYNNGDQIGGQPVGPSDVVDLIVEYNS